MIVFKVFEISRFADNNVVNNKYDEIPFCCDLPERILILVIFDKNIAFVVIYTGLFIIKLS